ncbi:MAG: HD domain-containing phosphohydrolase [Candidatus Dormibacter sp.]
MRLPIRYKIILPFAVLLVFVGVVGTGVATARLTSAASAEYDGKLLDSSVVANQSLAQLEADRVAQLRAATNTVGVPDGLAAQDRATLERLLTPIAANAQPASLVIHALNPRGENVVTILGGPSGGSASAVSADPIDFSRGTEVTRVLAGRSDAFGDRYLFLSTERAPMLYWVGPVRSHGGVVGAILIGQRLADIAQAIQGSAFYSLDGQLLASSLPSPTTLDGAITRRITAQNAAPRDASEAGHNYRSLFSEWIMRGTTLGYLGVQVNTDQLESSVIQVRLILTLVFTAAALLTLLVGGVTASLLTRPIDLLVRSMRTISAGDLHHRAPVKSHDEIGYLAQALNEMASSLEEKTAALEETYFASMEALARAIDARDPSTFGHSARVAAISLEIAEEMGLSPNDREALRRSALLHDIGKIGIDDHVLRKPGPLSAEEAGDMQEHPRIGHDMLKGLRFLEASLPGVLHHHERWDGRGYPYGLAGTQIPVSVRILTVADVFDAMTSDRPYRKDMGVEQATDAIRHDVGIRFDADVVTAFLKRRDAIVARLAKMGKVSTAAARPAEAA